MKNNCKPKCQYLFSASSLIFLWCFACTTHWVQAQVNKAPAYPLIAHDPYFSVWSFSDNLNGSTTRHWTGSEQSLTGFVKVDGKTYSILGEQEKVYKSVLSGGDE